MDMPQKKIPADTAGQIGGDRSIAADRYGGKTEVGRQTTLWRNTAKAAMPGVGVVEGMAGGRVYSCGSFPIAILAAIFNPPLVFAPLVMALV